MTVDPFRYIPPDSTTAPIYEELRTAESTAQLDISGAWEKVANGSAAFVVYQDINDATKKFHEAIRLLAPPSADTSAALRCVRLARMLANEAVKQSWHHGIVLASTELTKARMQASAAVALQQAAEE